MEAIKALLKQIATFWEGKDTRFRRNAIIIASAALLVVIVMSVIFNQVPYAQLYSGLDAADSTAVLAALDTQKVPYRVSGDAILVPAKDADSLRMSLSTEVKNGFNLDILQQGQGLGLTESDKQDYRRYQIQVHLQNDIKTLKGVKDAKVILTMPTEGVLVLDSSRQEATAGIILTLDDGVVLSAEQAKTIALHVKNGVQGLKLENISIMDSNMQNLDFTQTEELGATAKDRFALQEDVRTKLRKQVMDLLRPVFGLGRVEAQVSVTLDFDSKTVDSVKFEPSVDNKNGIVVSIDKLREQIVNGNSDGGQPGTATNTGTGTTTYPVVNVDNGTYEKNAEKINYEINSIKEHLEKEKGAIKSLSVAVVIDNANMKDDYTDTVKSLVAQAVGVSGDYISVAYLPMAGSKAFDDTLSKDAEMAASVIKNGQNNFYIILGAIVLVLLVAMVLAFSVRKAKSKPALVPQAALAASEADLGEDVQPIEEEDNGLGDIKIIKESGAKEQIGKLIDRNPELVANLLRSWLADEQE